VRSQCPLFKKVQGATYIFADLKVAIHSCVYKSTRCVPTEHRRSSILGCGHLESRAIGKGGGVHGRTPPSLAAIRALREDTMRREAHPRAGSRRQTRGEKESSRAYSEHPQKTRKGGESQINKFSAKALSQQKGKDIFGKEMGERGGNDRGGWGAAPLKTMPERKEVSA